MAITDLAAIEDFQPLSEAALKAKAWPFEEARKLQRRLEQTGKQEAVFETGYGPSGLPHIGTFGEVARTTMVRTAFRFLTKDQIPTRLICFSDDMDGMRKVPGNVPNADMLEGHLGKPLSRVPNPFGGEEESFAHHNNAMLRRFLNTYGFDYEFASATDYYTSGKFDDILVLTCERYQQIMDVMLPTLGEERQATYSPILPISPTTGRVLYVPMKDVTTDGMITFEDEDGKDVTMSVKGGNVKLQWKPDFGMRWAALGVDYEMFGKDHQANAGVYSRICKILGQRPPETYVFELFLDDKGEKISKTKGNGIAIDEWLRYASPESLALFMYQKPRTAKRLYFDVIPKAVDEYATFLQKFPEEEASRRVENPTFHIHGGIPPQETSPLSFSLLLNLVSAANAEDKETLWGFISRYAPEASPETHPLLDQMAGYALNYYGDFVKPTKVFRAATDAERAAMTDLAARLRDMAGSNDSDALQTATFDIGKAHNYENLREWFKVLYQVLLGQDQGPRFGIFVAAYGPEATADMIDQALDGAFLK